MLTSFACGEPLCKRLFEAVVPAERPWPIKCPGCNRSLYPATVLQSTALDSLDPHRGPLMRAAGGKLVPVLESELTRAAPKPARAPASSLLDEIADATMARQASESAAPERSAGEGPAPGRPKALLGIALALVALALIWWLTR